MSTYTELTKIKLKKMRGIEVRSVAKEWKHPMNKNQEYKKLIGYDFIEKLEKWKESKQKWKKGFRRSFEDKNAWIKKEEHLSNLHYKHWIGSKPKIKDYMPQWEEEEKTHIQMYRHNPETNKGIPVSPVFEVAEDMDKWLTENKDDLINDMRDAYNKWLLSTNTGRFIKRPRWIIQEIVIYINERRQKSYGRIVSSKTTYTQDYGETRFCYRIENLQKMKTKISGLFQGDHYEKETNGEIIDDWFPEQSVWEENILESIDFIA